MYNIIAINKAEEIPMPTPEAGIVIANEPVIMPEEEVVALEEEVVAPEEEVIGVIEEVTGVVVEVTGVIEEMTGVDFIVGDKEYFSGMIQDLSGETLYNISGDVVGEIYVESGEMVPVDLSGVSLLPTPLSVVYPTQSIRLDQSGYITFDTLQSVTTTGGEVGANYCSRIAYENLTSILKAGVRTRKETNDYLLKGDAEDLVIQGLEDHTLLEVTSGDIQNIFSGKNGTGYGFVYDIYASFMDFETKTYHRMTVVYADDSVASDGAGGQRYVLDPLRGARTTTPQKFTDYIAYYDDEIDVQWYIGQAYSPSVIKDTYTHKREIQEYLQSFVAQEEEIFTGEIQTGVVEITTGENLPEKIVLEEIVSENTGEISASSDSSSDSIETGTISDVSDDVSDVSDKEETITENYFTKAYERGEYSEKIIQLQNVLTWLELYAGEIDGMYSDAVIESLYQYQLAKNILSEQDAVGLRGYLGPSTRIALNQSYGEYQNTLEQETISIGQTPTEDIPTETGGLLTGGIEMVEEIGTISGLNIFDMFDPFIDIPQFSGLNIRLSECQEDDRVCRKKITEKLLKEKGYTLSKKGLVQLSKDALIGSDTLDMKELEGELLTQVVLQSSNELSGKIAEVQIPENTMIMIENNGIFTGEINVPVFLDTVELDAEREDDVIALVDVGTNQQVNFEDGSGNKMFATFRIPAPGLESGDEVDVYYSQNGEDRNHLTAIEIQFIDGEPYAVFEADHFTQFYLGVQVADFVINNNVPYTDTLSVTLNMYVPTATQMRFGNSIEERNSASWEPYVSTKSWVLTGGIGMKTIYAEFDNGTTTVTVEDTITYLTQLITGAIVFNEDFSPANYYSYDWTRQGTDRDSVAGSACYGGVGNCAHGDGNMTEVGDRILTNVGLIDLSDAVRATMQVKIKEDNSFDAGDYFRVRCKNAGGNDVLIYEEDGGDWMTNTTWHTRETMVDPSCLIADVKFKITQIANNNNEDLYVDDFVITKYTPLANTGGVFGSIAYVTYAPYTFTNGDVVASLTGLSSGDVVVTNNNGSGVYVFTGNGSFTFELQNSEGITGEVIATVNWIDKESPVIIGVDPGATYTGEITVDFSDNTFFSGAVISGMNIEYYSGNIQSGTIELCEGNYEMIAYDMAGNSTSVMFTMVPNLNQKIKKGLINGGYVTGAQALVPIDSDVFVGSGDIDLAEFEGELLYPIVIQSVDRANGLLAEVEIPAGVKVKDKNGNKNTKKIRAPKFKNPQSYQNTLGKLGISAMDVGDDEQMKFENSSGEAEYVIYRMPVPGREIGELIDVYFSEDNGNTFEYGESVNVVDINGDPYVIFIADHFTVVVTAANGGTNISADKAANSSYGSGWTLLSPITIAEGVRTDFANNQSSATLILSLPNNRQFLSGSCTPYIVNNVDMTAVSYSRTNTTLTLYITTDSFANNGLDSLRWSGCQVQSIDGSKLGTGNILRLSSNSGTFVANGIVNDVTNFGTLSQIPGIPRNLLMTLSGQTFEAVTGNVGLPVDQYSGQQFVIPKIRAIDQYTNIATSYSGAKTLSYTGATGTVAYTTGVTFVAGQSTTTLNTTISSPQAGISLRATDGIITGLRSTPFNVVLTPVSELVFSATGLYENSGLNNGSISGNIVMTLSTGSFSPYVISSGYVSIANLPTGLSGSYILSGTKTIILSLTGTAVDHYAANSTGIYFTFLSGAFVDMVPEAVTNAVNKYISLTFYDPAGYIPGQQLRLKGILSGGQFYDYSPQHRTTTNNGAVATTRNSVEPIMSFDGNNRYVDVGTYTLTNYTVSARFNASTVDGTRRSIVSDTAGNRELSLNETNQLEVYNNGGLTSTVTIAPNTWYHVAVIKNTGGTQMYINGVLNTSNTSITQMVNVNLTIGDHVYYVQPRSGYIDEVKIYDSALTSGQVETMYIQKPSYVPRHTHIATPDLRGLAPDQYMTMNLVISGVTYPVTNNQDGTWQALSIGPFASGTYDVQLNYMNVYGKTGMIYYTGGLIVYPDIYIIYEPATLTSGNVVATVTGYDIDTFVANNNGSSSYTFTGNGSFTFELETLSGDTATITAIVGRIQKASISYNTGIFYENTGLNNGSIANMITATLSTGSFSHTIVSSGYVTISNVPAGLTGVFTLSGSNQVVVTLSGNATSHASANSVNNLIVSFLTGAFSGMNPSDVGNATQTGIAIQFYDDQYTIGGGQLRLDGSLSGAGFDDLTDMHVTTGAGGISNSIRTGEIATETVIGPFDGSSKYVSLGNYTLSNYTIATWIKTDDLDSYHPIITNGADEFVYLYTDNKITLPEHGLSSTTTLGLGTWYHVALVQSGGSVSLYVDGKEQASGTTTFNISNLALYLGYNPSFIEYRQGLMDEVHIYSGGITSGQIYNLYMKDPSFTPRSTITATPDLRGLAPDPKMTIGLTIDGKNYSATNNQDGTRSALHIGPLASGVYDVQVNYMNVYGKTGMLYYTGGLIVSAPSISYSSLTFYENSGTNNGSITGNITATLTGGAFSSTVVSSGYVTISNVPAGLTGVFTLSGTNKVIIALSGNATNHTSADTTSGLIISFLTGAFSGMNPSDVVNATQTGVAIQFYDDKYYIGGGQLRLDGSLSGAGFDDLTDMHITTGAGGISNSIRTGEIATETVIGPFDGSSKYVSLGNYTLSNYTIATWIKTDDLDSYHPIITNGSEEFIYLYTDNKITLPSHGSLKSTTTLGLGTRYHIALVQNGGSVSLYVDGKEQASGTTTFSLNNLALYLGYNPNYTEYRQGLMDEVHIYSGGITSGQIYNLYMKDPSFTPRSTITATPDLRGLAPDPKMTIGLTIDGKNYSATNNQDGTRSALHIGPLASGVYDVQVNYMNVYGKTGVLYYTGGLTVNPLIYIEYAPETQTSGNVVATVTGYQSITGAHVTNNGGSPNYTFTSNGSFTFELANASGDTISITAIVDRIHKAEITYSTDSFYENTGLNNGSIVNAMVATLTNDTFSSDIITNGLIQMTNIPAGLTGKYTLSGNTQLIIELTGSAINHNSDDGVYDITLSFLTGAFSTYMPGEVKGSIKTDIHLHFYDALIGSGTLRLDGSYSGVNYYDLSQTYITTGTAVITGLSQSGETIMGFNGSTSYIDIGTYTLPEYTMSAWIYRSNMSTSYQSIIARNGVGTSFEISTYNNLINLYSNGGLQSTVTIQSGQRYHIAVVKDTAGTKLYVNGELNNSNTFTGGLTATALAVGRWNTSQYRSGNIDEVHIYDDTLSATQVKNLYLLEPSYAPTTIYTGTTTLTGLVNDPKMYSVNVTISGTIYTGSIQSGIRSNAVGPLATGIYDVQINYMNVYGKTGTLYFTGGLIVTTESTGSLTISGPVSFNFDNRNASMQAFSIEKTFSGTNDYFQVLDTLGSDTGYYTTISISNMTNGEGDMISSSAIAVKALTGVVKLSGTDNPRVYSAITGAYQYFSGPPMTFIARDTAANGGVTGIYGMHTMRKIDVPALQDPGNYTGVITYTLY